jgi:hypothetical protein
VNKLNKMAVVLGVMGMCVCVTLAQEPVSSASEAIVPAGAAGGGAGVAKASTWSDMTAIFRPARWAHPIAVGGTLSWLNYHAWADAPGRTTKVLAGEVIIIGTAYWLIGAATGGGGGGGGGGAISGGGGEMPF